MHKAQLRILKKLALAFSLRFSELMIGSRMTSEHFTYHVNALLKLGYISKVKDKYGLTMKGKMYVNQHRLDDMEGYKGPVVAVMLFVTRKNHSGQTEILLIKRLRHPHYGLVALPTSKVLYGERFEDAASRVLKEETGLDGFFEIIKVYRKMSESEDKIVQDIIFVEIKCENPKGKLKIKSSRSENFWVSLDDIDKVPDLISDLMERLDDLRERKMEVLEHPIEEKGY